MKCNYCQYEWVSRIDSPIACPNCKNRLDKQPIRRIVGLQIGGTVGLMDSVGMYIPMPINPGIGVKVMLDSEFDQQLKAILENIPSDNPKAEKIRTLVGETLKEKDQAKKLQQIQKTVIIGAGITEIAVNLARLSQLLGF